MSTVRLTSREAIAGALQQIREHFLAGHIVSFNFDYEPSRTARLTLVYAHDAEPIEVSGFVQEPDED